MNEAYAKRFHDAAHLQAIDDHYWANAAPIIFLAGFVIWCATVLVGTKARSIVLCRLSPIIFVTALLAAYCFAASFETHGNIRLGLPPPYPYPCADVILIIGRSAPPCEAEQFTNWAAKVAASWSLQDLLDFNPRWICTLFYVGAAYALAVSMALCGQGPWWLAEDTTVEEDLEAGKARSTHKIDPEVRSG